MNLIKSKIKSNAGVSLIELVIAVAVFTIIAGISATALYTSVRSEAKNSVTRQNVEQAVGNMDLKFDSTATGTDMDVTVEFPADADEDLECTKIMDDVYGLNVGIVKVK